MEHLDGKVAVITGGASGIGLAMANRFGRAGMRLVLGDIEAEALAEAAAGLRGHGFDVTTSVCDVSDGAAVEELARVALDACGAVHVVCNNAGVGTGGLMETLTDADWRWVIDVNLWGVIHGIRVFLPLLQAQGEGHIVNTASVAGLFSAPFMGPYNASKFAVVAISETLWHELRMTDSQVGVSVLCPSWVKTRIAESARNRPDTLGGTAGAESSSDASSLIAGFLEKGKEPEEVADLVLEGIVERRFYLLTHDDSAVAIQRRAEAIVNGGDPPFVLPQ